MNSKYSYLLIAILLLIGLTIAINNALPTISFLRNPSYTNGIVVKVKERNSIDADLSFDYYIEYYVNGARYQLIHTKSINPAKYDIGDTVIVKFSSRKLNYSTAYTWRIVSIGKNALPMYLVSRN